MRRLIVSLTLVGGAQAAALGCASIYQLDEYATAGPSSDAGRASDAGPVELPSEDAAAVGACATSADCVGPRATAGADAAAQVCVAATSRCASVLSADCTRVYGDPTRSEAVLIGALLGAPNGPLERAAVLAASEINAAGGLPPRVAGGPTRPIVLVGCDAVGGALRAARHLVEDLRVAAVLGPLSGDDVLDVTQQVSAKGGALLMTPSASASAISDLSDGDLTWRDLPSDAQRAKLVIDQINALEDVLHTTRGIGTVKLAVVHRKDALGTSARASIAQKLVINGRFLDDAANAANVSADVYAGAEDSAALGAVAARYAESFRPDVVFVTAPEQIAGVVVPLERALAAARVVERPYYVLTEAAKTDELLAAFSSGELGAEVRRRIRGVGVRADTASASVLASFQAAFAAREGAPPAGAAPALTYDATYAVAYAAAAGGDAPSSGASVADGLRSLGVGAAFTVGPADLQRALGALSGRRSISLRGTHGLFKWAPNGDIESGTVEVWCVGAAAGKPAFGSSGLTMDVATQVVGGAYIQCQ